MKAICFLLVKYHVHVSIYGSVAFPANKKIYGAACFLFFHDLICKMWQVKNSEFLNEYSKIDFCKKNFSSWNSWVNSTKWNWTLLAFSSKQKSNNKLTNFLLFYLDLDTTKAIFFVFWSIEGLWGSQTT